MPNADWFAILCSNPLPTNANTPQKSTMIFAVSFVVRAAIHTARHTSMLQSTPRLKSSQAGTAIFSSATFMNRSTCGAFDTTPDCAISQATANEPARFPMKDQTKIYPTYFQVIALDSAPMVQTILLPVNNSDPAKITNVRAMPNDAPITSFSAADP